MHLFFDLYTPILRIILIIVIFRTNSTLCSLHQLCKLAGQCCVAYKSYRYSHNYNMNVSGVLLYNPIFIQFRNFLCSTNILHCQLEVTVHTVGLCSQGGKKLPRYFNSFRSSIRHVWVGLLDTEFFNLL